jgi:hypothetical protein
VGAVHGLLYTISDSSVRAHKDHHGIQSGLNARIIALVSPRYIRFSSPSLVSPSLGISRTAHALARQLTHQALRPCEWQGCGMHLAAALDLLSTAGQVAGAWQRTIYSCVVFGVLRGSNGCRAQRGPTEASCRPPVDGATCVGGAAETAARLEHLQLQV